MRIASSTLERKILPSPILPVAAAARMGKRGNKVAFEKIDVLVGQFDRAKSKDDKTRILAEMRALIESIQREQQAQEREQLNQDKRKIQK
jgi:hypothetical protein